MFAFDDERDEDLDTDDADIETKDSDDEDKEDDEEDEGDTSDDSGKDEDDDKPLTRRDLMEILKKTGNRQNADRRVSKKNGNNKVPPKDTRLDSIEQTQKNLLLMEEKRTFGFENNLTPDEVEIVYKLTSRPTRKFLELPHVKGALEGHRAHRNVKANTPGRSGKTFVADNGKDWKDLSDPEKQANFTNRRRALLESRQR